MSEQLLVVDGKRVPASAGATFTRTNPFDGSVATVAAAASVADALAAADSCAAALPGWASTPHRVRRRLLLDASALLESRADLFVELMAREVAATEKWARFNVAMAAGMLLEAAGQVYNVKGEILPADLDDALYLGMRVPAGVVLSMAPWNAPIILAMRAIAFPVAYGNTVLLKASELSPAVHLALGDLFTDSGFPPGVVNVVSHDRAGAPRIVESLIAHRQIRRVNFTGSTPVGRIVGALAGQHLKPSLLELGGKNPLIVLDDADLDYATRAAAFGAFANNGQACMASNRIIVQRGIADRFIPSLAAHARTLRVGDPADPATQIGPLADPGATGRVRALIDDAIDHGAALAAGGENDGALFTPTVLTGVTPDMTIYAQEIFGPVAPITVVDTVEQAVELANDTTFGLSSGIITGDHERGLAIAQRLRTGMAHVNDQSVNDEPHVPFGGVGDSGYGRFGGEASIHEFTELRWVSVQNSPRHFHL